MRQPTIPANAIAQFREHQWNHAHTFYLDALKAAGISLDDLSPETVLRDDADVKRHVNAILEGFMLDEFPSVMNESLAAFPLSGRILYAIATSSSDVTITLACALALRQLIENMPDDRISASSIEDAAILLGGLGMDILFESLICLDLDEKVFLELQRAIERSFESVDYYLSTLLRCAAVHDVHRSDIPDEDGLYTIVREMLLSHHTLAVGYRDSILVCDIVHEYCCNGNSQRLADMLQQLHTTPSSPKRELMISEISAADEDIADLFTPRDAVPSMPLGNPMRDLHRLIDRETFKSEADVQAFMQQYMSKPIPTIPWEELTDEERAEDLVDEAAALPDDARIARLRELAEQYGHCMAAWLALATESAFDDERLRLAEQGLANAGKFATMEFMADANGNAWGISQARTYLLLLHRKMMALVDLNRMDDAIAVGETIRRLELRDVLGTHMHLLNLYIRRGVFDDLDRAEVLLASMLQEMPDDVGLHWLELLLLMVRKRAQPLINAAFAKAMQRLPLIGLMIAEVSPSSVRVQISEPPEELHEEIRNVYYSCINAWNGHPDAQKKLAKLVKAYTG